MSNRPDWCPADVWESADRTHPLVRQALSPFHLNLQRVETARAILSERERCAKHLENKAETLYVDYNDKGGMYLLEDVAHELLSPDP